MKKLIISATALVILAGVAHAGNRSYDLRDLDTLNAYTSDGIYLPAIKHGHPTQVKTPFISTIDHTGEHQNSSN
jgi:hypothetical protein